MNLACISQVFEKFGARSALASKPNDSYWVYSAEMPEVQSQDDVI
jgi:hypothetical protein